MTRRNILPFLLVIPAILTGAADSWAQAALFGPAPGVPYTSPGHLFSLQLPPGWTPYTFQDKPELVEFRVTDRPGTAWLQIKRTAVAPGAKARQLLARAVDTRLKSLPHFTELSRRDVSINGLKAASILGTYWYQGNAQYPRALEEIYIVFGNEAFETHFECFQPLSGRLAGDLEHVYATFVPRPQPPSEKPPTAPQDEEDPLDKIPF